MVADIENLADSQGRSPEIARRTYDLFQKEVPIHLSGVELHHLLADRHIDLVRLGKQLPGRLTGIELFPGILLDSDHRLLLRQCSPCIGAGDSAFT